MFVRVIVPLVTDRYQQFCLPEFIVIVHLYEFFFLDFQKYIFCCELILLYFEKFQSAKFKSVDLLLSSC